jgi:hypothetical protein
MDVDLVGLEQHQIDIDGAIVHLLPRPRGDHVASAGCRGGGHAVLSAPLTAAGSDSVPLTAAGSDSVSLTGLGRRSHPRQRRPPPARPRPRI